MAISVKEKAKIDALSYEELLRQWRYAPLGDKRFQGDTGLYWSDRMEELRRGGVDPVAASKAVGWGPV